MGRPSPLKASARAVSPSREFELSADLERELRDAVADIERGDCLALTPAQLGEWAETGALRVLDEWLAGSRD